ncbi:MAG: hypothetical protein R6U63_12255 [Longimicrobiales bacterium]
MAEILFVSDRGGQLSPTGTPLFDIYRVGVDGLDAENITLGPAQKYFPPLLSPGGDRVVFDTDRVDCYNVWVMDVDGSALTQLTGGPTERCNEAPRWSPDGSMIAFTSSRESIERSWEVYVMNADGSGQVNVSDNVGLEESSSDWPHGWSPDGRIVFHSFRSDTPPATYLVDPDGTDLEPMFASPGPYDPFWSPDGERVAYVHAQAGDRDIWVMDADGSGVTNLSDDPANDSFRYCETVGAVGAWVDPWSPDGTRLAFASDRSGNWDIFIMNADGTGLFQLTDDPGCDVFNGWSEDGSRILFSSNRSGDWNVYVANVDGTGLFTVTEDPANDRFATWLP